MKFWNWGPTTIWHNIQCVAFFLLSKSLHPSGQSPPNGSNKLYIGQSVPEGLTQ